ncbi:MAG: sulfatase [bacterium]|nr:sulfatase [bacterium]
MNVKKNSQKKVLFLLVVLFIFIFVLVKSFRSSSQPNLLLITVDSLPANRMEIYGYDKNTTPGISQWAKKATIFTNVNITVPNTVPSMDTLMTGQHTFTSKITQCLTQSIDKNTITLASILKKNNFVTGAFYTFANLLPKYSNLNTGFDTYSYINRENNYTDLIKESTNWLNKNINKRFFLWLYLRDPAVPFTPTADLQCKFNANYCDVIASYSFGTWEKKTVKLQGCHDSTMRETAPIETLYDGEIAQTDRVVTTILNKLQESGLDKKTIVIFTSATGEGLDHNYYFYQGEVLYDSAVRVPLIIKNPLSKVGTKKIDRLIDNTDILPTILDLLNVPSFRIKTDGKSFSSVFDNNFLSKLPFFQKGKEYTYSVNVALNKFSIFDGKYKYIYSLDKSCLYKNQKEELYDLEKDPKELHNIMLDKSNDGIYARLNSQLLRYLHKYKLL